jgi:hypothetical protein
MKGGLGSDHQRCRSVRHDECGIRGLPSPSHPPHTPVGVKGVSRVADGADTIMYRDRDTPSTVAWWLVD